MCCLRLYTPRWPCLVMEGTDISYVVPRANFRSKYGILLKDLVFWHQMSARKIHWLNLSMFMPFQWSPLPWRCRLHNFSLKSAVVTLLPSCVLPLLIFFLFLCGCFKPFPLQKPPKPYSPSFSYIVPDFLPSEITVSVFWCFPLSIDWDRSHYSV